MINLYQKLELKFINTSLIKILYCRRAIFMDKNAYFFRDIENIYMLERKTMEAKDRNRLPQRYNVYSEILLEIDEFERFLNDFQRKCDFLETVTANLTMNLQGEYVCALVRCVDIKLEILVSTFQYGYPRFVALKQGEKDGQ